MYHAMTVIAVIISTCYAKPALEYVQSGPLPDCKIATARNTIGAATGKGFVSGHRFSHPIPCSSIEATS